MTASGTLRTTVKEAVPDVLGHGKTKWAPKDTSGTSSSTGGAIWSKPSAAREAAAVLTRPTRRVTTVMTASGLLRTSVCERETNKESTPVVAESGVGGTTAREREVVVNAPTKSMRDPSKGEFLSLRSRQDLSSFIATAILPKTNRVYEKEWTQFQEFVKEETGSDDPFLTEYTDDEKASMMALLMMRRHRMGKRGKAATAFTAAVRQMFAREMKSTAFFDSSIIETARSSCLMKPDELRAKKDNSPQSSVKLPICESILADMRARLWLPGWSDEDKRSNASYVGTMYGFDAAGRVGEFTHCELGNPDHCARVDDFTFTIVSKGKIQNVLGSGLVGLNLTDSVEGRLSIAECAVRTVSSKGKVVVKPKLIKRLSPEEAEFLDDLASWIIHSGTTGKDEVFSFRKKDGSISVLTGRTVRDEIKTTCASNGLPPDYFSAHSLRKGAITHMRAQGATEDDRRDRGNYAVGSQVMNQTYDYASGLGPLASNSLKGGYRLDKNDLKKLIPPSRKSV
jgi:hypothetical protein